MTNSKHIPKRRFKEFESNGEWELLTLSDISEGFEYGLNVPAKEFDGVNKYLRITDIDDTRREFLISNLSSPDANCESLSNYLLAEGDILFARTGASTGKTYYYKETDGKVFFAGFLIRARVKGNFDHRFVFQNTLTKRYKNYIELTSQRSGQPGVNAQEYSRFSLNIPSLSEQKVIGDFVEKLDSLISKHQHKLDKLKNLKKAYLSEMFPAEGERVPKRRFPGFEGEWEQTRLGDIAERFDNLRVPVASKDRVSGTIPYYGANGIQDYVDGFTHNGEFVLLAEDGANDLKNYPVHYVKGKIWVNNHAHVIQGKEDLIDNQFLLFAVKQIQIEPYLVGGGRAKLNADIMMDLPLIIPEISEQKSIGSFLMTLEKRITLQQQKLDKLNDLKKAYLNELFV